MATLSVQSIVIAGITPTFALVAVGGDKFPNTGRTFVQIKNSSGANPYTVTFTTTRTFLGITLSGKAVTVGTNGNKKIGPFPPAAFDDSDNNVNITYTGSAPATDLTIGVFKAPRLDL